MQILSTLLYLVGAGIIIFLLTRFMRARRFADKAVNYFLIVMAFVSIVTVFLIGVFIFLEAADAFQEVGVQGLFVYADGLAVIAHPDIEIDDIGLEELRSVAAGKITNYSQLGGQNMGILVIGAKKDTLLRDRFDEIVMTTEEGRYKTTEDALLKSTGEEILTTVAETERAIGYIPMDLLEEAQTANVNILTVGGIAPTFWSGIRGKYPVFQKSFVWRPQKEWFSILPMIYGSILVTIGAIALGVPVSLGVAIFLAEIAPNWMRNIVRPAVELLAGIPSVVYGLFGLVVIVPFIRNIPAPRNTGFGLLSASIVLAIMIGPTVANIAEDAIRAVPRDFKQGSLALGATHWQTIVNVILPAARSGIIAAIILGIGRAVGETMAMIMVIGNSVAIPAPLNDNPLTLFLSQARTLTGNIAVEINYATGIHRSALFATGVVLFLMIMAINSTARLVLRKRSA